MHYNERLKFYLPDSYDERVHDSLVNPAGGGATSIIGSLTLVKSNINAAGWIVGSNPLCIVSAGGLVRLESFSLRVTTAFTSGGAPTFLLQIAGNASWQWPSAAVSLANMGLNTFVSAAVSVFGTGVAPDAAYSANGAITPAAPRIVSDQINGTGAVTAQVGTAVYTGGQCELVVIYTPLKAGSTLS